MPIGQQPQVLGDVDVLDDHRRLFRPIAQCRRIEGRVSRCVAPCHFDAVDVSDETIVVLNTQGQRIERR